MLGDGETHFLPYTLLDFKSFRRVPVCFKQITKQTSHSAQDIYTRNKVEWWLPGAKGKGGEEGVNGYRVSFAS